jgi:V8-like Glu-specific endopeptidase
MIKRALLCSTILGAAAPAAALEGELAGNKFPFVGQIVAQYKGGARNCTATVLNGALVVAAAHCLYHVKFNFQQPTSVSFTYADRTGKKTVGLQSWHRPDSFVEISREADAVRREKWDDASAERKWEIHAKVLAKQTHDIVYFIPKSYIDREA